MSTRTASWLAWSLATLGLTMFVATVALHLLARLVESPGKWITLSAVSNLLSFVPFLAFPLVGALIASRRPHSPIGWILLADGSLWMLGGIIDSYRVYSLARPGSIPFPVVIYALGPIAVGAGSGAIRYLSNPVVS
jgi:hypothetical protein